MSNAARVRAWFLRLVYSQNDLIVQTEALARKILPSKDAKDQKEKAEGFRDGFSELTRWDTWRLLIRAHKSADIQLNLLNKCHRKINFVEKLRLNDDQNEKFVKCFANLGKKSQKMESLKKEIEKRQDAWKELQNTAREVKPPVFFSHSLLKLSDSTQVESVSLFIAGLIALGGVYMAFFFESAVGLSASAYWTLDDLINHGILVIPAVVLVLILIEAAFFIYRRLGPKNSYKLHQFILEHPTSLVVCFFVFSMLVASWWGYSRGATAFGEFADMREDSADMATITDGTVLRDIYLVGTSDRTAIFLQAILGNDEDKNTWSNFVDWSENRRCLAIQDKIGYAICRKKVIWRQQIMSDQLSYTVAELLWKMGASTKTWSPRKWRASTTRIVRKQTAKKCTECW